MTKEFLTGELKKLRRQNAEMEALIERLKRFEAKTRRARRGTVLSWNRRMILYTLWTRTTDVVF
jgi:hypothetical protein